jgi:hypothetical protein
VRTDSYNIPLKKAIKKSHVATPNHKTLTKYPKDIAFFFVAKYQLHLNELVGPHLLPPCSFIFA